MLAIRICCCSTIRTQSRTGMAWLLPAQPTPHAGALFSNLMVDTIGPRLGYKSSSPSWHRIYFLSENNEIDTNVLVRRVLWALPIQSKAPVLIATAPGSFLKCRIQVTLQTCLVWIHILTPDDFHAHQEVRFSYTVLREMAAFYPW